MRNCSRHYWVSDRMECLHCASESGWKVVLGGFSLGSHGHLLYTLTKRDEPAQVLESCPLAPGWVDRRCPTELHNGD